MFINLDLRISKSRLQKIYPPADRNDYMLPSSPKFLAMKIVETTNSRLFLVDCLSQNIIISSFLYCHQPPTSKCLMASAKRRSTSSVNSPDWAVGYTDMICKWRVLPPTSSLQLRSLIRGTFNKDSDKI